MNSQRSVMLSIVVIALFQLLFYFVHPVCPFIMATINSAFSTVMIFRDRALSRPGSKKQPDRPVDCDRILTDVIFDGYVWFIAVMMYVFW